MQEEAIRFGFSYGDGDIKDEFNSVITIKSNDDAQNIIELQKDGLVIVEKDLLIK